MVIKSPSSRSPLRVKANTQLSFKSKFHTPQTQWHRANILISKGKNRRITRKNPLEKKLDGKPATVGPVPSAFSIWDMCWHDMTSYGLRWLQRDSDDTTHGLHSPSFEIYVETSQLSLTFCMTTK